MSSNWAVDFFRGVALDFWRQAIPAQQTRTEVEFLLRELCAGPNSHFVDVPCGLGRHSIGVAQAGSRVTGIDLSEECIREARAASPGLPIDWVLGDMRTLDLKETFDGAFCMGNSIGYLNADEVAGFLRAVARVLRPGSRFVLETGMVAESILRVIPNNRWMRAGDIYMLSESQYHPGEGRLDVQYIFLRNGEAETRPSSSYVFTVSELSRMHVAAGLQPLKLLESVEGEPYQIGSSRLILISEKDR